MLEIIEDMKKFKDELKEYTKVAHFPISIYRKWKKERLIRDKAFEIIYDFSESMAYSTLRELAALYHNIIKPNEWNTWKNYNLTFEDFDYDRNLTLSGMRVIIGDYYVELCIDLKVDQYRLEYPYAEQIDAVSYDFTFYRDNTTQIKRRIEIVSRPNGTKTETRQVDNTVATPIISGYYENFIIENTFVRILTTGILRYLRES